MGKKANKLILIIASMIQMSIGYKYLYDYARLNGIEFWDTLLDVWMFSFIFLSIIVFLMFYPVMHFKNKIIVYIKNVILFDIFYVGIAGFTAFCDSKNISLIFIGLAWVMTAILLYRRRISKWFRNIKAEVIESLKS